MGPSLSKRSTLVQRMLENFLHPNKRRQWVKVERPLNKTDRQFMTKIRQEEAQVVPPTILNRRVSLLNRQLNKPISHNKTLTTTQDKQKKVPLLHLILQWNNCSSRVVVIRWVAWTRQEKVQMYEARGVSSQIVMVKTVQEEVIRWRMQIRARRKILRLLWCNKYKDRDKDKDREILERNHSSQIRLLEVLQNHAPQPQMRTLHRLYSKLDDRREQLVMLKVLRLQIRTRWQIWGPTIGIIIFISRTTKIGEINW